jgi:GNAT superfamily N-acetyltransferase
MAYIQGLPEDEREHSRWHDHVVNGLPTRPLKSDRVLWEAQGKRITVVIARSPRPQRNRAEAIASLANLETNYNGGIYHAAQQPDDSDIHLFLYHERSRALGLAILEKRSTVWRCRWRNSGPPECEELKGHEPMWSVAFLWVHRNVRRTGVARRVLARAMHHLCVSCEHIGWYTPFTDDGRTFVKALCPIEFYVGK